MRSWVEFRKAEYYSMSIVKEWTSWIFGFENSKKFDLFPIGFFKKNFGTNFPKGKETF